MKHFSVKTCRSESYRGCGISFFSIPRIEPIRQKWIDAIGNDKLPKHPTVCSHHFWPEDFTCRGLRILLNPDAVPSLFPGREIPPGRLVSPDPSTSPSRLVSPDPCRSPLGQSNVECTSTRASSEEPDQSSRDTIQQCRLCGDFSSECVPSNDSTTLAYNDLAVQIDFNDHSLPKTICQQCVKRLQEIQDFIKVVKNAQKSLIVEDVERDPLDIKIECEDSISYSGSDEDNKDEDYESNDGSKDSDDDNDNYSRNNDKDGNDDSHDNMDNSANKAVTKETAAKRKINTSNDNFKKAKVTVSESDDYRVIKVSTRAPLFAFNAKQKVATDLQFAGRWPDVLELSAHRNRPQTNSFIADFELTID